MARDSQAALVALNRFGFGARGGASGDFVDAASDPRGFVKAELNRTNGALLEQPVLLSTPALGKAVFDYQFEIAAGAQCRHGGRAGCRERSPAATATGRQCAAAQPFALQHRQGYHGPGAGQGIAKEPAMQAPANTSGNAAMAPAEAMQPNPPKPPPQPLNIIQKTFRAEALARLQRAVIADCGFVERLVVFWSNHFCISANKGGLARMWAGSFEREAIRPHVLGRFGDMLKAVEQHPAMLFFLDNQQSLGPDSRAGQNRNRGLNENLAREIMELHTLGVGGGYTQDDVTSLARIITGWTFAGKQGQLGTPGTFVFNANAHQPGAQRVMGKVYQANGVAQGEAVLSDIARHPSTAKFIATKFVAPFRGRRSAAGSGGAAAGCLHPDRRRSQGARNRAAGLQRGLAGAARQDARRLTNSWSRPAACWRAIPKIPAPISIASTCSASRCGRRPGRTDFPTAMPRGPRRKG